MSVGVLSLVLTCVLLCVVVVLLGEKVCPCVSVRVCVGVCAVFGMRWCVEVCKCAGESVSVRFGVLSEEVVLCESVSVSRLLCVCVTSWKGLGVRGC
jgi:hypothetical protein